MCSLCLFSAKKSRFLGKIVGVCFVNSWNSTKTKSIIKDLSITNNCMLPPYYIPIPESHRTYFSVRFPKSKEVREEKQQQSVRHAPHIISLNHNMFGEDG